MSIFRRCHQQFKALALRVACLLLVTITIWGGVLVPTATADSVGVGSQKAAAVMRERATNELDRMGADGAADAVGDALESIARNSQELSGEQLEDAAQKAENKAKRDIRRTKRGAAKLGDKLENAVDSVQDALD